MLDKYLVWGNPISHSLSPQIHALFAKQLGLEIDYNRRGEGMNNEEFVQSFNNFFNYEGGKGCNVTSPFKHLVFELVSNRSEVCQIAQSCNTVIKRADSTLYAENTDGYGLVNHLNELNWLKLDYRILILGAGGAVSGVLFNLLQEGVSIDIFNRTPEKAIDLVNRFAKFGKVNYVEDYNFEHYDLVINAIPYNSQNNDKVILKDTSIKNNNTKFYDMQYNATKNTVFLEYIINIGVNPLNTSDGLGMLVKQAALSFYYWFGTLPDTTDVANHLREYVHLLELNKKNQIK